MSKSLLEQAKEVLKTIQNDPIAFKRIEELLKSTVESKENTKTELVEHEDNKKRIGELSKRIKKCLEKIQKESIDKNDDPYEDESEFELHVDDILASSQGVDRAAISNISGKGSQTEGPLHVHKLEDGRYLLTDGYHRFAQGIKEGKSKFPVKLVSSGYTDYHASPTPDDEFKAKKRTSLSKSQSLNKANYFSNLLLNSI